MLNNAPPGPLISWRVFLACWVVLALVPAAPSLQDGFLSNLSPVGFGYLALVSAPTRVPLVAFVVLGIHVAASFAAMLLVCLARRRLGPRRFAVAGVVVAVLAAIGATWFVQACWPDGIFFDASNIHYDVSDLVRAPSHPDARFADAEAVANGVLDRTAGCHKHYLPCRITPFLNEPTIVAWGTWTEHYHFRRELESLRRE